MPDPAGLTGVPDPMVPVSLGADSRRPRTPVAYGRLTRHGDVGEPATIVLVRHGQTPMTVAGQYSGSSVPGPSLNPAGLIEAARAADLAARIGRDVWADLPRASSLVSSSMVRAQDTARAVSRRLGLPVSTDDAFAEANFGDWEGRTASEIANTESAELVRWHVSGTQRAPGGESAADVGVRVADAIARLAETGAGKTVVVVAHTIVIRAAIGQALDAPASRWNQIRITPGSTTILRRWPDGMTEVVAMGYAAL